MNPADLFRLAEARRKFNQNHPKFAPFLKAAQEKALQAGAVIEISVTPPEGEAVVTNLRVQESDLELLRDLMAMGKSRS